MAEVMGDLSQPVCHVRLTGMLVRSVSLSPDLSNNSEPRPTKTLLSSHPLAPGPSTPGQEVMFHWSLKLESLQVDSALTIPTVCIPQIAAPYRKLGKQGSCSESMSM